MELKLQHCALDCSDMSQGLCAPRGFSSAAFVAELHFHFHFHPRSTGATSIDRIEKASWSIKYKYVAPQG